ncbi:MAG: hypothetical protein AAGJ46_08005 [Planctomycetota bacterium]
MSTDSTDLPPKVRQLQVRRPSDLDAVKVAGVLKVDSLTRPAHDLPEELTTAIDEHATAVSVLHSSARQLSEERQQQLAAHLAVLEGVSSEGPTVQELVDHADQRRVTAIQLVGEVARLNLAAADLERRIRQATEAWLRSSEAELEALKNQVAQSLRDAGQGVATMPAYGRNASVAAKQFEDLVLSNARVRPLANLVTQTHEHRRNVPNRVSAFSVAAQEAKAVLRVLTEQLLPC